jgi:hypothetical protein
MKKVISESELRSMIRSEIANFIDEGLFGFLEPTPMKSLSAAATTATKKLKPVSDALKQKLKQRGAPEAGLDKAVDKLLNSEESINAIRSALKSVTGTLDQKIDDLAKRVDIKGGKVVFN